ncbi:MAG: hypothetical protein J5726_01925 [Treponema sp.]|nr:hypothetical protein [Treponema sp.]
MKTLINGYRERYYISRADLANAAETNRLHALVVSPILFVFGFGDLIFLFAFYHDSLREHLVSFIYFGVFTLFSFIAFIYSRWSQKLTREKAYIHKTIPFYMLFSTGIAAGVYNFYILGQPFNGVVTYCLTGFTALLAFSFSPFYYTLFLSIGFCFLAKGVYLNFGLSGLLDTIVAVLLMFCFALYKRRTEKKYIMLLKKQKKSLVAKTFGNFTLLYENTVIKFSRSKSPELLAYLIYKNGSSVQTKELLSVLYGDHADSERYGASLRNLIVDVKHTLADLEIQKFFIAEYNNFRINPEVIRCDYYDFLAGDPDAIKQFAGEFMSQYSWAEQTTGFLEMKALKK